MSTTYLPFLVPLSATGMPMAAIGSGPRSGVASVMKAAGGHDPCTDWVLNYSAITSLSEQLPSQVPVAPDSEFGDYYFELTVSGIAISLQSQTTLYDDVVNGDEPPATYQHDGQTYNIVGSIEHTIAFDQVSGWSVSMPIMLLSSVPMAVLGKVGYQAFLKPIISGIYQGVRTALTTEVESSMDEAALVAAADTAAEVADIGELVLEEAAVDATLSLETGGLAMIGFVGLIAVQVGIMLVVHPSYHQLLIYNFTDYDLCWGEPDLKHEATITQQPVTDTTGTTPLYTLPAMTAASPSPFIAPVNTASMAQFNLYSDSEIHGIKWGLSLQIYQPGTTESVTEPVGVMWDIPLGGQNSIGVGGGVTQSDLSDWVSDQEGKYKEHARTMLNEKITVTNSIDHLQGKHPMELGSDDTGYIYRSVLVFTNRQAPA